MRRRATDGVLLAPAVALFVAFWLLPMGRLALVGAGGKLGFSAYTAFITNPRYLASLVQTVLLAAATTATTLVIGTAIGLFLTRNKFPGRALLVALITFPLAFPGVVIGFMVIMLAGRQGLIGSVGQALFGVHPVFAYSLAGLFLGYLYFSLPRVVLTIMAAGEGLDVRLEEAARSLGAGPARVLRDVLLPGLRPALISAGAICFATAMGAFGTAFTLATNINVLPIVIYTEFTVSADFAMAAALSIILGLITWSVLILARTASGNSIGAAA